MSNPAVQDAFASPWQSAWNEARSRLEDIQHSGGSGVSVFPRITRVGKLDAELLDQELVQVLQEPLTKAMNMISVRYVFYLRGSRCDI